jgi:hypothetical protein
MTAADIRAARADLLLAIDRHGEPVVIEALKRVLNEMKRAHPMGTEERAPVLGVAAKLRGRQQSITRDDDIAPW